MEKLKEKLVLLHHCRGISWKNIYLLLKTDPSLQTLYSSQKISSSAFSLKREIIEDFHSPMIREQISQYEHNGITAITYFDTCYPPFLKEIYQPPWVLYAKGDLSLLTVEKKLAIVGSRLATNYSQKTLDKIIPELIKQNIIIVSGLAAGVDTIAHKSTIANGGKTIGVIAGGLFHIYPKENKMLASEMMNEHLVLSEYPPLSRPNKWQFPMRNRIISGICDGTLIVEAKRKSGSLITANYAVNEGRDVFAIPGSILSPYSAGTNDLIKAGAKPVSKANDILEEWNF
ncbi:DNA-processing protein DprA [Niallia sp. 03133]|uniref:DNA-processing protein DprA n=1 Tax=Niallia sp. 03133 TaxID=3458060 RepID=UPI004043BDB4